MKETALLDNQKAKQSFYTDEHHMFRDSLKKFLEKEAVPFFDQWESDRIIPRSFWAKMGENGFICPWVSEEYGGLGTDFGFAAILGEELARVGAGLTGIGTHSNIIVPYIASFGTEEQKKKYLPKCVSGEMITAIAMTEPGAGSDLASLQTRAVEDGDDYRVGRHKTWTSGGGFVNN